MDAFDRFVVTLSSLDPGAREKASQATGARVPDAEYGLVMCSGPRKTQHFPMATPEELTASMELFSKVAHVLPPRVKEAARLRMDTRRAEWESGVSASVPPAGFFWEDDVDGASWRQTESTRQASRDQVKVSSPYPVLATCHVRGEEVALRTKQDVVEASTLLHRQRDKLSAAECRSVAQAVVRGAHRLAVDDPAEALLKLSDSVRAFAGEEARPEGPQLLRQRASQVEQGQTRVMSVDARQKISDAYRMLADVLETSTASAELEKLSRYVADLDAAAMIPGLRPGDAHRTVFLPYGEKSFLRKESEAPSEEDFEYVFGSTMLRKEEIEHLAHMNLLPLAGTLGEATVDRLRDSPVATFRGLTPPQKRYVARFVEDLVKTRGRAGTLPSYL